MDLKSALKRVLAMLPKGNLYDGVLFSKDTVSVTNGLVTSVVKLDGIYYDTDMVVGSEELKAAAKVKGNISLVGNEVHTDVGVYTLHVKNECKYLGPPEYPKDFFEIDISSMKKVIGVASKTDKDGGVPFLNFTKKYIESTDRCRAARCYPGIGWEGVLPIELFNRWPTCKSVFYGESDIFVFFELDGEMRIATKRTHKFPSLGEFFEKDDYVGNCIISTAGFIDAVSQASDVSSFKGVAISFDGVEIKVEALNDKGAAEGYFSSVKPIRMNGYIKSVYLNGTLLIKALKLFKLSAIRISYGEYPSPVKLSAGGLTVLLWPLYGA